MPEPAPVITATFSLKLFIIESFKLLYIYSNEKYPPNLDGL